MQEELQKTELEIGYHLLKKYWHKGYAIEAAELFKNYAFENNLCQSLISIIHINNTASHHVAIKNGMLKEKQIEFVQKIYCQKMKIKQIRSI